MTEKEIFDDPKVQRYFGVELNMQTWDLLGKQIRTEAEDQTLIGAAHASYYHWMKVGNPENFTRGEWLISHVYSVLGRAEPALYHAKRALDICSTNNIGGFDLAYANESMARALACGGNLEEAKKYHLAAKELGSSISDPDAKQYFDSDFSGGPWYGL